MPFRKRNVVIGTAGAMPASRTGHRPSPGTRPSPLDGRATTSTGTASLDQLQAGHGGIPLGTSLLIEESGTTDFGGVLLRYFAAEGLVQGHLVHILGLDDSWRRELPGLTEEANKRLKKEDNSDSEMKIAWRYEKLVNRDFPAQDSAATNTLYSEAENTFCHSFDLTKRLESSAIKGTLRAHQLADAGLDSSQSAFGRLLADVATALKTSPPSTVHRIAIPSLLSPTLYGPSACRPDEVLHFLHRLRALLRRFPSRLVALVTVPTSLHPRGYGLTRWAELLCDGAIELVPLRQQHHNANVNGSVDKTQGLLRIHSLPVFHEKGGGLEGSWVREDMAFRLSASSGMVISPYSLPPLGDDVETNDVSGKKSEKGSGLDF